MSVRLRRGRRGESTDLTLQEGDALLEPGVQDQIRRAHALSLDLQGDM
jgi:hypothetical protein